MNEFWVTLGIIVIALITVITIYNRIINRMNAVERAWATVITQERQKNKIIPHLEQVVDQYKMFEESVHGNITELRSALKDLNSDKVDTEKLRGAEVSTARLLQGLHVTVENYPELKAVEVFNNLMREITEQQENIGAAIRIFNQNVEDFNNGIEVFPNYIVNQLLNRKTRMKTFSDSEADSGYEFKPNFS